MQLSHFDFLLSLHINLTRFTISSINYTSFMPNFLSLASLVLRIFFCLRSFSDYMHFYARIMTYTIITAKKEENLKKRERKAKNSSLIREKGSQKSFFFSVTDLKRFYFFYKIKYRGNMYAEQAIACFLLTFKWIILSDSRFALKICR